MDHKDKMVGVTDDGVRRIREGEEQQDSESVEGWQPSHCDLPVVEQIGTAAEHSDCCGDQASADRWLPPSVGHQAGCSIHTQHSSRPHAQTGGLCARRGRMEDMLVLISKVTTWVLLLRADDDQPAHK